MRFILLLLLFLLGMTVSQKLHNDRPGPSHLVLSKEVGKLKENISRNVQQPEIKSRSPFFSDRSHHKKFGASNKVPPYAVQMEPLVQYSQPDPLFKDSDLLANESSIADSKSNFKNTPTNKINKIEKREHNYGVHFDDNEHESTHNTEFSSYGSYVEGSYPEEPEPIIEIIIKESNQTLPAPPPVYKPPPKKKKEPVQVFYVKYKKDPSAAYGEDKIIYEAPVPAVTPPTNHESSAEETEEETREEVTLPPAPSTTLKAIIRPDSEIYHGSGLHITFGGSKKEEGSSYRHPGSEEQQSAPQASVLLPDRNAPPLISRSGSENQPPQRHPSHFEAPSNRNGGGSSAESRISYRPPAPTSFQQTPQFPAQPFRPTHNNLNNQYFTLPLHLRNPNFQTNPTNPPRSSQPQHHHNRFPAPNFQFRPEHQTAGFSSASQPYQTIKHSDPQSGRFSTTSRPPHNPLHPPFHSSSDQLRMPLRQSYSPGELQSPAAIRNRPNVNTTDQQQYRDQIEQLNRLQQQQQRLQAQIFQNNENKPNLVKQSSDSAPEIIKSISPDDISFPNHRPEFPTKPVPNFSPPVSDPTFPRANLVRTESRTIPSTKPPVALESSTSVPVSQEEKMKKEEKKNQNVAVLPKEVPDDLREQLLSSGILNNADIQILDYDKIGDIPVENLPPEALANFQAVAGSEQVPVATPYKLEEDSLPSSSENRNILVKPERKGTDLMEMKVVRFNPEPNGASKIADKYMKEGATRLEPVVLNDSKYNRYLPLKISGTQFPVPDVPELQGRNVTSVVILAPVDYEFLERRDREEEGRLGRRSASPLLEVQGVHFVAGDVLKDLVKIPNTENYKKWLDKENKTAIEKQSVVLLVVEPTKKSSSGVKDIFMYDIATQRVSKLKGELSSTFVKVAESNSQNKDLEEISDNPSAPGGDFTIKNTSELPP